MKAIPLLFLLLPSVVFSQNVKPLEIEIGPSVGWGIKDKNGRNDVGQAYGFIAELRYNMPVSIDMGVQFRMDTYKHTGHYPDCPGKVNKILIQALGDYNFYPGKQVNPFAGAGVGAAIIDESASRKLNSFCISPRTGVELFRHLRLTLNYCFLKQGYSYWNFSAGIVLGGGVWKK